MSDERLERELLVALSAAGYLRAHGPDLAPGGAAPERSDLRQVVLVQRLRRAIRKLNPTLPQGMREAVLERVLALGVAGGTSRAAFLRILIDGVALQADGDAALTIDHARPGRNEWLAVSRFAVPDPGGSRSLDIVLFVNGLPLVEIDLQGPAARGADRWVMTRSGPGNALQPYGRWRVARDREANPAGAQSAASSAILQALVRERLAPKPLLDALGALASTLHGPAPQ
jgi:hypothetical protein